MRLPLLTLAAYAVTGCAHNDVLYFGTDTQFAISATAAEPAQGGSPEVVIGYQRREAVAMPLLANGRDSRLAPSASGLPDALYRSEVTRSDGVVTRDAYSVFASLGANLRGSTDGRTEAAAGLAQFFATGNAAIAIADNEALVTALKVEAPDGARAQAQAVAAASVNQTSTSIAALMSPAERTAAMEQGQALRLRDANVQSLVVACATRGGWRWPDIVRSLPDSYDAEAKGNLTGLGTPEALQARLRLSPQLAHDAAQVMVNPPLSCPGVQP